jgi:UDP-galactopyranose mutase
MFDFLVVGAGFTGSVVAECSECHYIIQYSVMKNDRERRQKLLAFSIGQRRSK